MAQSHGVPEGRNQIKEFLKRKWDRELGYRLKKSLWGFRENRVAVQFEYEWHDDSGQWYRSHGVELWEFEPNGLMGRRIASINDSVIRRLTGGSKRVRPRCPADGILIVT